MEGGEDGDARMRERFKGSVVVQPEQKIERVQKNLSLDKRDVGRMLLLAKREELSQAQLIKRALDAYEDLYGKAER